MNLQASLLPPRIEPVPSARLADEESLRRCYTEADAIVTSIALSGLTYREIAAHMGRSKSLVNAMAKGERGLSRKNTAAFCNATGTLLIVQYREMVKALDRAMGRVKERDRIAAIAEPTRQAWGQAA